MNRHFVSGLVLGGCLMLAMGVALQPERSRDRRIGVDEALVANVELYVARQSEAVDRARIVQEAGKFTGIEVLAIERADLESRILLAQITEDNEAAGALLTELVERDAAHVDLVTMDRRRLGTLTYQIELELAEQLARSSFRLWEHRREFGKSK